MDSRNNRTESNGGTPKGTPKKKKRCRIRNRPRNKCNRISKEDIQISNINSANTINETINISKSSLAYKENNNPAVVDLNTNKMQPSTTTAESGKREKTREEIMAEREAKKLAKQAKKTKSQVDNDTSNIVEKSIGKTSTSDKPLEVNASGVVPTEVKETKSVNEKSRDEIKAEREAKKQAKQAIKTAKSKNEDESVVVVTEKLAHLHITGTENATSTSLNQEAQADKKKPALSKAERRALQEAQRAAKAEAQTKKQAPKATLTAAPKTQQKTPLTAKPKEPAKANASTKSPTAPPKSKHSNVKLFNHLENSQKDVSLFINNAHIHPSIARLGEQYAKRIVVGSNARCIAFMNALKMVIQDFETPPRKEFARSLEAAVKVSVDHLQKCRPLAVSVGNAYKHIKHVLTQLQTDKTECELKEQLCRFIDTYIENQIEKAALAISSSMQEKITNGDVILTFGCSSLINYIFEEAQKRGVDFRVIVVDARPFCEGQELLRRLTSKEIPCTYVLINAVGFVMPEVTKVLLGAHALLSNGYVMARTGTAQVALVANSFNVPVLVCCETHKFSERFQTDAIVYNELGDPQELVLNEKCCLTNWQMKNKMSPLNLIYDITPPELVTAVVTEVSVLPCTSVPVILRIKPTEMGY